MHASDINPRTVVIQTKDDIKFLIIEGRQDIAGGLDLFQVTKLCQAFGAINAINLDGGGSVMFRLKNKDNTLICGPAKCVPSAMSNVILVKNKK